MTQRRLTAGAAILAGASIPGSLVLQAIADARGLAEAKSDPMAAAVFAGQHPLLTALFPAHGILMNVAALVVVVGLSRILVGTSPVLVASGSALGLFWIFADLLQGLVRFGPYSGGVAVEHAEVTTVLAQAIWHAGRIGAGLWILTVGAASRGTLGTSLRLFSLAAGSILVGHPFLIGWVPTWYGLELVALPVWFVWTGVTLRHDDPADVRDPLAVREERS